MKFRFTPQLKIAALIAVLVVLPLRWNFSEGAGARLVFLPGTAEVGTGDSFSIKVSVDSGGGTGINAAEGTVKFDSSLISVTSVSKDGSVFSLWTSDPTFSNTDGTASFSGGSPSAYTGAAGTVVTINFKALKEGSATISFDKASVLAADGNGTEVLSEKGTATVNIGKGSPAAPVAKKPTTPAATNDPGDTTTDGLSLAVAISSPTHPDENKWYANNSPRFTWKNPPGISGISTILNDKPTTDPPRKSEGMTDTKDFQNVNDGVSYFHARFKDQTGNWSQTVNRKVQVDMEAPAPFHVAINWKNGDMSLPYFDFFATDSVSGVESYSVAIEGKDAFTIPSSNASESVRSIPVLPGHYKLTITARDRAGNTTAAESEFTLKGIAEARITDLPSSINADVPFFAEGIANPRATVIAILEGSDAPQEFRATADENGRWIVPFKSGLRSGSYKMSAKMITADGAESAPSSKLIVRVNWPILANLGWIIIALLTAATGVLGVLLWRDRKHNKLRRISAEELAADMKRKNKAVFEALHEEVEERLAMLDLRVCQQLNVEPLRPEIALEKIKDALDVSQEAINRGLQDIVDLNQ
jgi:hypothetical protein